MTNTSTASFNWHLLKKWIFVCAIFYLIRLIFDWLVSRFLFQFLENPFILILIFSAISNAIGSVFQWYVLKNWIANAKYWVLATSLSYPLALILVNNLPSIQGILSYTVIGLIIGIAQYLVLRGKLPGAGLWILANGFSFAFGNFVINQISSVLGRIGLYSGGIYDLVEWFLMILNGVIYGIITGLVLVILLSKLQKLEH
ncbi:MAG TPA: hypothetical protein VK184_23675 [Nostocaceae cyanobacterium]|nr:hypothetical protein [Nostocaceae cyanobacterium]